MPSPKELIAFKLGARARKLANEDCIVEGYELLVTALAEAEQSGDAEMTQLLKIELEKYEKRIKT
jgi:predicted transcriptional regulator